MQHISSDVQVSTYWWPIKSVLLTTLDRILLTSATCSSVAIKLMNIRAKHDERQLSTELSESIHAHFCAHISCIFVLFKDAIPALYRLSVGFPTDLFMGLPTGAGCFLFLGVTPTVPLSVFYTRLAVFLYVFRCPPGLWECAPPLFCQHTPNEQETYDINQRQ